MNGELRCNGSQFPGPKYSGGTRSNVVCIMAAILSRPQCVLIRMTLYYMLPFGHTMCSLVAVILQRYQSLKSEIQKEQNNWSLHALVLCFVHYDDVIMSPLASQITSLTIVYWIVYSDADKKKTSKLRVTGLCVGNSPGTGEFPAQMASYAENVSIWWRHHEWCIQFALLEWYWLAHHGVGISYLWYGIPCFVFKCQFRIYTGPEWPMTVLYIKH